MTALGDLEKCRPWHSSPRKSEKRGFRFPSFSITCGDLKWRHIPVPRGHLDFSRRPLVDFREWIKQINDTGQDSGTGRHQVFVSVLMAQAVTIGLKSGLLTPVQRRFSEREQE
jgi:hypothetical protein